MSEVSLGSTVWGSNDDFASTDGSAVSMEDASMFRQYLQASPQGPTVESPSVGSVLNLLSATHHELDQKLDKGLKRVSRTGDPVEMVQLSRHLSEIYTNHSLAVKVIGKATSSLDSLMRMQ